VAVSVTACGSSGSKTNTPSLAQRGTTMTKVKPSRKDLANQVSLSGKVEIDPVYGLAAPVGGQIRYVDGKPQTGTPTKPTRVATIHSGNKTNKVDIPAGSVLAGRLVEDKATVLAGMPVVSARYVGYGIVAEIDGAQAYRISDGIGSIQAQIKNGPGPFACTALGAIAALPAGTLPERSAPAASQPGGNAAPSLKGQADGGSRANGQGNGAGGSEPTGIRLVCTAPGDVKMINGATVALEVVTQKSTNVLVLPVEAVAGLQGKGKVDVLRPDGTRETREVVLGLTDGKVIEIKSGLTGDETIAVPGPNLPTARPGGDGGASGGPGDPAESTK
jgi:hypothetical protein